MTFSNRWAYMSNPNYNRPNDTCPHCTAPSKTCTAPSKTYTIGAKTVEGVRITSYKCEHKHEWVVTG